MHCLKPLSLSDNDPTQVTTFPHPFYIIPLIKYMNTKHREEKPKNCHFMVLYCHAKPTISATNSFCTQAKTLELCFGLYLEETPGGTSELISLPPQRVMLEADAHHKMQRAEGSCRVGECLRAHGKQKPATGAIKGLGHGAMGQWVP